MIHASSLSEPTPGESGPLRVLLVNYWYPPLGDGAEKQAHLLARGWSGAVTW